jgi:hypothetical protein
MVTTRKLNSIVQSLQSLSPQELAEVLQSLPQLEIGDLRQLLAHLQPRPRVELIKQLIFATRPEYVEDLKYVITTEYQLRQSRGELTGEAAPLLNKTKLETKRIPYRRKDVEKGYTYVYAHRRRDGVLRCLGRLLQTEDSHEYRYTLLENGAIVFDAQTIFCLTHVKDPEKVMWIRLLKLEAAPLEYEFDDGPLQLQVPLIYEVLHPETYHPISRERADFPDCVNHGIFKKQLWQVTAMTLPEAVEWPELDESKAISELFLEIPAPQVTQVTNALMQWQQLSQLAFASSPWYLATRDSLYQLIHSDGQAILEFHLRDRRLQSVQSPLQVADYFQQLGLALMQHPLALPQVREQGSRLSAQMQSFRLRQDSRTRKRRSPLNVFQLLLEV